MGDLGNTPSLRVLQELFPGLRTAGSLSSSLDVDYLLGLGKAFWYPVRHERAKQGGDL